MFARHCLWLRGFPSSPGDVNGHRGVSGIINDVEVLQSAQCHLHGYAIPALCDQQFLRQYTSPSFSEVGLHARLRVKQGTGKAVATGFFFFFRHVIGQCHYPVPQLVCSGEALAFSGAMAVQGDQNMFFVFGGDAGTIKIIHALQQCHLDAVLLQQFGQVGNGIISEALLLA